MQDSKRKRFNWRWLCNENSMCNNLIKLSLNQIKNRITVNVVKKIQLVD